MARTMNEAIPEEDYARMEKGLPPIKKPVRKMEDPESPVVDGRLNMLSIPMDDVVAVAECKMRPARNSNGVTFIGYDIVIQLKKGTVSGWISESEFLNFKRSLGSRVNAEATQL